MDVQIELLKQGAEARIYRGDFHGKPCIVKERFSKKYRHPQLDHEICKERLKSEVRSLVRCRQAGTFIIIKQMYQKADLSLLGVHAPTIYNVDYKGSKIVMEHIVNSVTVKDFIKEITCSNTLDQLASSIGTTVGLLHCQNIVHGDLTTSNLLVRGGDVSALTVIDFGLSFVDSSPEDKGVDLYVLERALLSTHPDTEHLFNIILKAYSKANRKDSKETMKKFEEIRLRGRKRMMIG